MLHMKLMKDLGFVTSFCRVLCFDFRFQKRRQRAGGRRNPLLRSPFRQGGDCEFSSSPQYSPVAVTSQFLISRLISWQIAPIKHNFNVTVEMSSSQIQIKKSRKRIRISSYERDQSMPISSSPVSENSADSYAPQDDEEELLSFTIEQPKKSRDEKKRSTFVVSDGVYIETKKVGKGKGKHWDHYKRYLDENDDSEFMLCQDEVSRSLTEMIIIDKLPFRHVEKRGFKGFVAKLCPTFKLPSRHTVARDWYELYLNEKVSLHSWLRKNCQRVSLTTGTWTSIQRVNYMVVTAHFTDNEWNLQKRILNFCQITSHMGESLARGVEDCLRTWGLDDKLFTITVHNASFNDVMCADLKEMIVTNGSFIFSGYNLHMRCATHIVNLIVNDGLKLHMTCVEKVRSIVQCIRDSPARLHVFKEEAKKLNIESKKKIVLDVATKWDSTYMMLDVALKYKSVLVQIDTSRGDGDCLGAISTDEWKKLEILVKFLAVCYEFTKDISGSSYLTISNVFFKIGNLIDVLKQWMSSEDSHYHAMATQMKVMCDKYWGSMEKMNMLIFVAIVLNPAHKLIMVEIALKSLHGLERGRELTQHVKDFTMRLFEQYKVLYATQHLLEGQSTQALTNSTSTHGGKRVNKFFDILYQKLEEKEVLDGGFGTCELERYLIEKRSSIKMTDILGWWRLNEGRYPILAHMARDMLAIPVTIVSSKSAFSTGERTLDEYVSSLNPKIAEGLLCARDWLLAKTRSNFNNDICGEESSDEEDEEMIKIQKDLEEFKAH